MTDIVCFNVGSSSLSCAMFRPGSDELDLLLEGGVDLSAENRVTVQAAGHEAQMLEVADPSDFPLAAMRLLVWIEQEIAAKPVLAHRVVHGGAFDLPFVSLTDETMTSLESWADLAPIHQLANLAPARAFARERPDLTQVAVFDTAFHGTLPNIARLSPLPVNELTADLRRYGFHGLSYDWVARHMARVAPQRRRVVALHLSGGSSACALQDGQSVDTTMGTTPLDGMMMGTRSGSVDPGALLALLKRGMRPDALEQMLWNESGLKGVSGISNDLRDLLPSKEPTSEAAVALYCRKAAKAAAAMAVSLGGIDALVFTGGIGAEQPAIRSRICDELRALGIVSLADANAAGAEVISPPDAEIECRAFAAQEERVMAEHTFSQMENTTHAPLP